MQRPVPLPLGPGQESVWDYPRPPRLELTSKRIQVFFAGALVADTRAAWRVLETSHPPTYYLPRGDVDASLLVASPNRSFCEWKGDARYYGVRVGARQALDSAWSYEAPTAPFGAIAGCLAFYAAAMERCLVDGELVTPQPGGFYGGWVTSDVKGPFKGEPGTMGW